MTASDLPPGIPSLLRMGTAARVLNIKERTLKYWYERHTLPYVQPTGRGGGRYVLSSALAEFADLHGLPLNWEAAL